jgi:hypothetical protein
VFRTPLSAFLLEALFIATTVAQDSVKLPSKPGPHFFTITKVGKDALALKEVEHTPEGLTRVIGYKPRLKEIQFLNAKGERLTDEEVAKRVKVGPVVLVTAVARHGSLCRFCAWLGHIAQRVVCTGTVRLTAILLLCLSLG